MTLPNLLPFATYEFIMGITPGPNNVMLTAAGVHFGFRRTLPHILGISFGVALLLGVCCTSLGTLFVHFPVMRVALEWIGAAYLLYLGWRLLGGGAIKTGQAPRPLSFMEAAGFQFLNPKGWVICLTAASLFLPPDLPLPAGSAYLVTVTCLISPPCSMAWALFGGSMRQALQRPVPRRVFNGVMAVALAATGVMMVLPEH